MLSSVGILNGYQKIDPNDQTDRWVQNHRVGAGEWKIGARTYKQTFDVAARDEAGNTIAVGPISVSKIRFTIVNSGPPGTQFDITAISELIIS